MVKKILKKNPPSCPFFFSISYLLNNFSRSLVLVFIGNNIYIYIYIYLYIILSMLIAQHDYDDYIYIYIYILSSTDRLFHSIRTLQCGQTHRTLEAGIKIRPILRYTQYQTARSTNVPCWLRYYIAKVAAAVFIYIFIPYRLPFFRRALHYVSSGRKFVFFFLLLLFIVLSILSAILQVYASSFQDSLVFSMYISSSSKCSGL